MNNIHPSEASAAAARDSSLPALLAFERAAAQLSFRRAARDLSLSPSAISHQIRGLEEQFGVKLFVRGARSVRLTADGERYLAKISVRAGGAAGRQPRHAAASPRRQFRTLDQFAAVLYERGADPGAAGLQAAQPAFDAAHRGHASICRLQRVACRRRDPLWPRTFGRTEIRAAGRGEGIAGVRACVDQGRLARARRFVAPGPDPSDNTAAGVAGLAQGGRDAATHSARTSLARTACRRCWKPPSKGLASRSACRR